MPSKNKLGKVTRTARGFQLVEFQDFYKVPCSLQASSLAIYQQPGTSAIWLGTDDAKPAVMWHEAAALGVKTDAVCGWVPYPLPPQVQLSTRMHLNRTQVTALVAHLKAWLDKGTFKT